MAFKQAEQAELLLVEELRKRNSEGNFELRKRNSGGNAEELQKINSEGNVKELQKRNSEGDNRSEVVAAWHCELCR